MASLPPQFSVLDSEFYRYTPIIATLSQRGSGIAIPILALAASGTVVGQTGFLSGTIKLSLGKFTFKLVSSEGEKSTLTGTTVQP